MLTIRLKYSILLTIVLAACSSSTPLIATNAATQPTNLAIGPIKGFGISPLGFPADYSRFPEFMAEVGSLPNGGVMFNGAWRQDVAGGSDAGQIPPTAIAVVRHAANYGYSPIIVLGWRSEESMHIGVPANATNDWANEEAKALFKQMLEDFAAGYQPPYLFLGNESDAYYISNPEDYARWVSFYNEAYDAIKAASPETMVGPIFQYERISGQGAFSRWTEPQWGALEAHDLRRIDLVGITLYPWLGVSTPEEISDDYLRPLLERIGDKPIAITETGWPADSFGLQTAWETSPEAQVRYVEALGRILDGANVRILNWLHLNQMDVDPASTGFAEFIGVSLRDAQGNKRPVYDVWVAFEP